MEDIEYIKLTAQGQKAWRRLSKNGLQTSRIINYMKRSCNYCVLLFCIWTWLRISELSIAELGKCALQIFSQMILFSEHKHYILGHLSSHLFIHLLIHSFLHSFTHSFIQTQAMQIWSVTNSLQHKQIIIIISKPFTLFVFLLASNIFAYTFVQC